MTRTVDSSGNVWNLTNPNIRTIVATPNVAGTSLPANGTIPIPAAILHQAGSFLVLLNSMRLLWFGDWRSIGPIQWG